MTQLVCNLAILFSVEDATFGVKLLDNQTFLKNCSKLISFFKTFFSIHLSRVGLLERAKVQKENVGQRALQRKILKK